MNQQWHHLAVTRGGGRAKVYVDGKLEADEADTTGGSISPPTGPYIGDDPGNTEQVHGLVDDVRIYNVALSAQEIASLAAGTAKRNFVWDGSSSTAWSTASNWDLGLVPTTDATVSIPDTVNDPVLAGATTVNDLTIQAGGLLKTNAQNLTVSSTFSNSGTLQLIGSEATVSVTQDTDSGTWEYIGDGIGAATTHTIKDFGAGTDYYHLTINDPSASNKDTFSLGAALDVNGALTLTSGTLDVSVTNYAISVAGAFNNTGGTFTERSGTVTLDGTSGTHALTEPGSFYNLTVNGSGATWNQSGAVTVTSTLTLTAGTYAQGTGNTITTTNFTINGGTFTGSDSIIDLNDGSFNMSLGSFTNSSGGMTIERNFTVSGGTFTNTGKTVTFDGGSVIDDTTISCTGSLGGTVSLSKTGDGDFTVGSGCSISLGASPTTTQTNAGGGGYVAAFVNNGTITVASGTWTHNGDDGQTITNAGTITHSGTGWDINDASLTNNSGATITYSGTSITIERSFTQNGTFNLTGKTVTLDGTTDSSTLTCGATIGGLTINKTTTGTVDIGSSCTMSGDLTRTDGVVNNPAAAYTLTVEGNVSISTTDATGGANLTLNMGGANTQTMSLNIGDFDGLLTINKTGGTASLLTAWTQSAQNMNVI